MSWQSPPEIPPWRPEPTPPGTPGHPGAPVPPVHVPEVIVGDPAAEVAAQLRRGRRLLVRGALDEPAVTRLCATLMLLDGISADPVELVINSPGGPPEEAAALLDVIDLMRAPVATRVIGDAAGTAAILLARGTGGRLATAHARIDLRLAVDHHVTGRVTDIVRRAAALDDLLQRLASNVAEVTRLDIDAVRSAFADGHPMTADEALRDGLVDEIARLPRTSSAPRRIRPTDPRT